MPEQLDEELLARIENVLARLERIAERMARDKGIEIERRPSLKVVQEDDNA